MLLSFLSRHCTFLGGFGLDESSRGDIKKSEDSRVSVLTISIILLIDLRARHRLRT